MKHAELYTSAVTLLTSASTALTQDNLDEQRALVKKHIEIEAKLIKKLEDMIPKIENEKVVFLLNSILADEMQTPCDVEDGFRNNCSRRNHN